MINVFDVIFKRARRSRLKIMRVRFTDSQVGPGAFETFNPIMHASKMATPKPSDGDLYYQGYREYGISRVGRYPENPNEKV